MVEKEKTMQVILRWIKYIFIIYCVHGAFVQVNAYTDQNVSKKDLTFEVLSIETNQNNLIVRGWAFITYKQHYYNANDHSTFLEFFNVADRFTVQANLTNTSQTQMMSYFGSPTCTANSTYQISEVCNYNYEQVGFEAIVPLERFHPGETYQTNIISHAHTARLSYKTPLYYPMSNDLTLSTNSRNTTITSRLDATEIRINATTVLARKEPKKLSSFWFYGSNCSTSYRNQLFFQVNTVYRTIYEKVVSESTSYYRVSGNLNVCFDQRRRITEGSLIQPIWIASPYVLYSGTPLQINVQLKNQAPYFTSNEINIYQGEILKLLDHVKAIDPEEGDISYRIVEVSNSPNNQVVGRYQIRLQVSDLEGLTTQTDIFVNVLTIPNNQPIIYAQDLRIQQFSHFNPLNHVHAYDEEDGVLTHKVNALNFVDTSILGEQELCYEVKDSKDLSATKCIIVSIYSFSEYLNKTRYISKNNIFFHEDVPNNWQTKQIILESLLLSREILISEDIN